ncbi:2-C-methyl-D-erythritol 4-phosphate cytidylyltransferase [Parapusillimonas sp. SGNA-6]|nr:2-C-methyl-D-erythritol 4-phosphate cytidylyltransferase [Parapusillimonas sp. SGNA-6]
MYSKLIAIVPAAGIGARVAAQDAAPTVSVLPKQYRLLKGEPMLRWAVKALLAEPRVSEVRVAVAPEDVWVAQALAGLPRTVWRPCGGATRADTVRNALEDAALDAEDWVLVHDAARPGLPADALARLVDTCLNRGGGGILALPVADTVKRALPLATERGGSQGGHEGDADRRDHLAGDEAGNVARAAGSTSRDGLWLAQTPQMFTAGPLLAALRDACRDQVTLTDESSAMERAGHAPWLVTGSARNFKVTWPEDVELMEKWL